MRKRNVVRICCMIMAMLLVSSLGCVAKKSAEGIVITDVTPTPEATTESGLAPTQSIEGLSVEDAVLSDASRAGLYAVPTGADIALIINGATDEDLLLQETPKNLIVYSCVLSSGSEQSVPIAINVSHNGETICSGTAEANLIGSTNSFSAQIKLPQSEAAEYMVELTINDVLIDRQTVECGAIPLTTPEPTPEPTPAVSLEHFPFLEKIVRLDMITDDPENEEGRILTNYAEEHKAKGRFVVMVFRVVGDTLPLDQINRYYNTIAFTGGGDGFTSLGYNVYNIDWDADKQDFIWREQQEGFRIIFDIPSELALTDLRLELVNDDNIRLPIKDWSGLAESDAEQDGYAAERSGYSAQDSVAMADLVKESESVDGMKPGMQTSDIRDRLGGEDDLPLLEMETMQLFYMDRGYVITYSNSTKTVSDVCAYLPATGETARGVGIGSDYDTVKTAYMGQMNAARTSPDRITVGDDSTYLEFLFKNGIVVMINLCY